MALLAVAPGAASAQDRADGDAIDRSVGVWRLDALGTDEEIVTRLESLFRSELDRLTGKPMPSRREVDRAVAKSSRLASCDGSPDCLARIGKAIGVELLVSGNVAQLGDSYVVNLKVIDVGARQEVRRIASDPLRGEPDELIEAVRVAAYRLVAPEHLHGSIAILADLVGAEVFLDGVPVGKTPLPKELTGLALGEHSVRVAAPNHTPFEQMVVVRFQKTQRVVVHLVKAEPAVVVPIGPVGPPIETPPPPRWYNSTWFYVTVGVTAAVLGGYVGYRMAKDDVIDCSADPMACM